MQETVFRGACLSSNDESVDVKRERYESREVGGVEISSDLVMSSEKVAMSILRKERNCLVMGEGLEVVGIDKAAWTA